MKQVLFFASITTLSLFSCKEKKVHSREKPMIHSSVKHWDPNAIKQEKSPYLNRLELGDYLKKAPKVIPTTSAGTPFDTLNYNQVVAYKYFNTGERNPRVYKKQLNSLIDVIENQHAMNQSEADQFLRLISVRSTYGGMRMACFEPRLGIVFYKDGKYVDQISICMECNYMESSLLIPAYEKQKKISESGEYNSDKDYGFSKKGRNGINQLLKGFKFVE